MAADKVFSNLSVHFVEGMMFHDDMSKYYNFLGLYGYSKCHEYHFMCETKGYVKLCNYYMEHYNRLLESDKVNADSVIPQGWIKYEKSDVDSNTKRNAVKTGVEMWIKWETETAELLNESCRSLMESNEIASAIFLSDYVKDVSKELNYAKRKLVCLNDVNFDIGYIVGEQRELKHEYMEKLNDK